MNLIPLENLTFVPAYKPQTEGKRAKYGLTGMRDKPGVYFIKENNELVYVGMSRCNLLKALYRHFQHWKSWNQRRVSYKHDLKTHAYEIAVITTERDHAHETEKAYILKFNPRDNYDRYEEYMRQVDIVVAEPDHMDGIIVHEHFEHAF
jgi:hypothetical protein